MYTEANTCLCTVKSLYKETNTFTKKANMFALYLASDLYCTCMYMYIQQDGLHLVIIPFPRPDTLDPALLRPGRMDRKVEFGLPDLEVRMYIHTYVHVQYMY